MLAERARPRVCFVLAQRLMARPQAALKRQLEQAFQQVNLKFKEEVRAACVSHARA